MFFRNVAVLSVCLLVGFFFAWSMNLAKQARRITAYNNPNAPAMLRAVKANPNDAAAHSSLAHYYIARSATHTPDAIHELREVARIEPQNYEAKYLLAYYLNRTGKKVEAVALYRELAKNGGEWSRGARTYLKKHNLE